MILGGIEIDQICVCLILVQNISAIPNLIIYRLKNMRFYLFFRVFQTVFFLLFLP